MGPRAVLLYVSASVLLPAPFILWHAGRLIPMVADAANHLIVPYVAILLFMLAIAGVLLGEGRTARRGRPGSALPAAGAGIVFLALALVLSVATNTNIIRADTYYKQGKTMGNYGRVDASIAYLQKAVDLVPTQDYYYLFLGRSLLEKAQQMPDAAQRLEQIEHSLDKLREAQRLNPLNTDHTANLGRLYRIWGQSTDERRRVRSASAPPSATTSTPRPSARTTPAFSTSGGWSTT